MRSHSPRSFPEWIPKEVQHYLEHTEGGCSIRQLARRVGCHASTILRQVRRVENRREDPLIDSALSELARTFVDPSGETALSFLADNQALEEAALEPLAGLGQSGAVLAVADGMEKAVVVREGAQQPTKLAIDHLLAGVFALLDWISCTRSGRLRRYHITPQGRSAFSRIVAARENHARAAIEGFGEAQRRFSPCARPKLKERRCRYGLGETPLDMLARLLDKSGVPFLASDLVQAGRRLREDFELAQIGDHLVQNERYLSGQGGCQNLHSSKPNSVSVDAKKRATAAFQALGVGLSDIALRCCCHLEGLEAAEKQLGWSARSGKIVLRIALEQLKSHYEQIDGLTGGRNQSQMIG